MRIYLCCVKPRKVWVWDCFYVHKTWPILKETRSPNHIHYSSTLTPLKLTPLSINQTKSLHRPEILDSVLTPLLALTSGPLPFYFHDLSCVLLPLYSHCLGAPGWLSRLSILLPLMSWSRSSWVLAPRQALSWQLEAWSLLWILCLPLSLPLPHSNSLCPSRINKH